MASTWSFDPFYEYKAQLWDPCFHWYCGLQRVVEFRHGMLVTHEDKLVDPAKVLVEKTPFQRERLVVHWMKARQQKE